MLLGREERRARQEPGQGRPEEEGAEGVEGCEGVEARALRLPDLVQIAGRISAA